MSNYQFYPLSARLGILRIRERVFPASYWTLDDARTVARLKKAYEDKAA